MALGYKEIDVPSVDDWSKLWSRARGLDALARIDPEGLCAYMRYTLGAVDPDTALSEPGIRDKVDAIVPGLPRYPPALPRVPLCWRRTRAPRRGSEEGCGRYLPSIRKIAVMDEV